MAITVKTKTLYTLERPVWLDAAGFSKGINHDRQHLGIILAAGQSIRVRQKDPAGITFLLRLLNDDRNTESSSSFTTDWVTLKASVPSVAFIDTPYGISAAAVEYEYDDSAKNLPVYEKGGSETAFFNSWDSQQAEFSLLTTECINMLIPAVDKEALRQLHLQNGLDRLGELYRSIFEFYNNLVGISFEPENALDRNIHNRYFIKADKNGPGAGYYGGNWTAESTRSVKSFWLPANEPGWGALHEIGHGYEGKFMSDRLISVSEVWNNIYCACYQ